MGNRLDEHVLADYEKFNALLADGNWAEANNLVSQLNYSYPYQTADLLSHLFRDLPKHDNAETFVQVAMNRFTHLHTQYGSTDISWWFDTYQYIISGLRDHGFDLVPYYANIYELLLTCAYFEEVEQTNSVIEDAINYLGDAHPVIAKLHEWANQST